MGGDGSQSAQDYFGLIAAGLAKFVAAPSGIITR